MKKLYILLILLLFISCSSSKQKFTRHINYETYCERYGDIDWYCQDKNDEWQYIEK